jgi:hypothetical protein
MLWIESRGQSTRHGNNHRESENASEQGNNSRSAASHSTCIMNSPSLHGAVSVNIRIEQKDWALDDARLANPLNL